MATMNSSNDNAAFDFTTVENEPDGVIRVRDLSGFAATYRALIDGLGLEFGRSLALEVVLNILTAGTLAVREADIVAGIDAPASNVRRWLAALVDKGVIERREGVGGGYKIASARIGQFAFDM